MIPESFEYHRPSTLDEAISLLTANPEAKLLAGGHSLVPAMKLRLAAPEALVDLARLPDLAAIREEDGAILVGAGATHQAIASDPLVARHVPFLAEAASVIGDPAVRNRGTIGGSIAHADPAADYPAVLLAGDAEILVTGPDGERTIPADEFFFDLFLTALGPEDIITAVRFPKIASGTGTAYLKFPNPASRYAVVGVAAIAAVKEGALADVRVALNGVANAAYRAGDVEAALEAAAADAATIAAAAEAMALDVEVLSDPFASEEYRRHLARVFVRRAFAAAVARAG